MNCPICGEANTAVIRKVHDDRYGYPGLFALRRCPGCAHAFLEAGFTEEEMGSLYTDYYPRAGFKIEDYNPHVERHGFLSWLDGARASAFRWVPPNVRVLDIGCGFGETIGYHQARGCDAHGVEMDRNIERVAKHYGFKIKLGSFRAADYEPSSFDYVTMDQVLEHVANPVELLQGVAQVLKPGGIAIVSVPNAQGLGASLFRGRWLNWHAPYHMHFFSVRSMRIAVENSGLILERFCTQTPSAWLDYQWRHLLTFPSAGVASKFWTRSENYPPAQAFFGKLLTLVHLVKVNHLITRLLDIAGMGDNRLFILRKP